MTEHHTPFWVQGLHLEGDEGKTFTRTTLWRGNDPRPVVLRGDAYWQWGDTPYRGRGEGFCWTQALHDGLEGWHSTIFHSSPDDRFCVHPGHPDYAHVARVWDLVNANVRVPTGF